MIAAKSYQLADWTPDQPDLKNSITSLQNAIPQAQSYRSANSLVTQTTALDSQVFRAIVAQDSSGVINNFAGDAGKLYKLNTNTYTDVSKAGGYTVNSWEMAKFGDRIIAVALGADPQYYDMGSSTLFADLPGTPPKAQSIAIVRDFVVLGNIDDGGTQYPARIQWSGYNNSESWGVDAATQSDFQDLFGNGGKIQRIVPGEYGVIFQENSIWRMDYAGPPVVFRLDEVERGRGTPARNSVTWLGQSIYYWGRDGFYMFNGVASTPIGAEKVNRYVSNRLDTDRYDEMYGAIDRKLTLVLWTYPLIEGGREIIVYNWTTGKWGHIGVDVEAFTEFGDAGYSLDDLDSVLADIDSASISVDSTAYFGGAITLAAFDTSHKLGLFTGEALTATIDSGEDMTGTGEKFYIHAIRPLVEGAGTYKAALGVRDNQAQNVVFGAVKAQNRYGECRFHKTVRFPRVRLQLEGGFNHATGFEVIFKKAGRG